MKKNTIENVGRLKNSISLRLGLGALMFSLIFCASSAAFGQAIQSQNQPVGGNIQVGGNAGNVPVEEGQNNAGYQQAGQQQMDDQGGEGQELTETIPPAVAIPDADWVLDVPIDVQGISPEVQKIYIVCRIGEGGVRTYGWNVKMLTLENGAYQGRVLIGISKRDEFTYSQAENADYYGCSLELCQCPCQGTDCTFRGSPWTGPDTLPAFLRMNPARPFQRYISGDLYE